MATETVTLRPATAADADALAELVVQLFHAEVPGVLRGPRPGQVRLMHHLIEHELAGAARGRFMAVGEGRAPVGTASLRFHGESTYATLPPGAFALATRSLGLANTLSLAGNMLRASLIIDTPLRRGECYVYSVVVAEGSRGRGIGDALMAQIEQEARRAGAHAALLRVIAGNERARRLYLRRGYQTVARTSPLVGWLGIPSELMRKDLS